MSLKEPRLYVHIVSILKTNVYAMQDQNHHAKIIMQLIQDKIIYMLN